MIRHIKFKGNKFIAEITGRIFQADWSKIVKKLIVISQEDIEYVKKIARPLSDPRAIEPNFGKGIHKIIQDHKNELQKT
jgi:hypothetical protein